MGNFITDVLYDILVLIITAVAGMLVVWLRQRLRVERIKQLKAELAVKQELAALAVKFVEQVYVDIKGEEKYTLAANWIAARVGELGLKLTADEIKGLIEAALRTFKDEFGEGWANL